MFMYNSTACIIFNIINSCGTMANDN